MSSAAERVPRTPAQRKWYAAGRLAGLREAERLIHRLSCAACGAAAARRAVEGKRNKGKGIVRAEGKRG